MGNNQPTWASELAAANTAVEAGAPMTPEFLAWAVKAYGLLQVRTEEGDKIAREHLHSNLSFCARVACCPPAERSEIIQVYHESLGQSPAAQPETQPPRD